MTKDPHAGWRNTLRQAYETVNLAQTYAKDGAWLTAADRLESAAALFREANRMREAAFGIEAPKAGKAGR